MTVLTNDQDKLFHKIRSLLNKAESTTYEEEANSFFAKAQELMIRYRIDESTLWANDPTRREQIETIEVSIKDKTPGAYHKQQLLAVIAKLSSCKMYYKPGQDTSCVVGFPKDLLWVEMLYTSVTKQGSFRMAMAQAAFNKSEVAAGGKPIHTRTFRNNFWAGFEQSLSQRLEDAYKTATTSVAYTGSQALVLSNRKEEVDQWVRDNLSLGRGGGPRSSTYNAGARGHGKHAAGTVDITGGAGKNVGTRRQGQLGG